MEQQHPDLDRLRRLRGMAAAAAPVTPVHIQHGSRALRFATHFLLGLLLGGLGLAGFYALVIGLSYATWIGGIR